MHCSSCHSLTPTVGLGSIQPAMCQVQHIRSPKLLTQHTEALTGWLPHRVFQAFPQRCHPPLQMHPSQPVGVTLAATSTRYNIQCLEWCHIYSSCKCSLFHSSCLTWWYGPRSWRSSQNCKRWKPSSGSGSTLPHPLPCCGHHRSPGTGLSKSWSTRE